MANYNNRKSGVPSRNTSQFGGTQTDRLAFDDDKQAYRQFDVNCPDYYRFEATSNANGDLTKIVYYNGLTAENTEIIFSGDIGGVLNSRYFTVATPDNKILFYVWYNVDGNGVDPMVPNATGLEVPIVEGDSAGLVCLATSLIMENNAEFMYLFNKEKLTTSLKIVSKTKGVVTQTGDVDTGFTFNTLTEGTEEISGIVNLEYTNGNISGFQKY